MLHLEPICRVSFLRWIEQQAQADALFVKCIQRLNSRPWIEAEQKEHIQWDDCKPAGDEERATALGSYSLSSPLFYALFPLFTFSRRLAPCQTSQEHQMQLQLLLALLLPLLIQCQSLYQIGVGIADVTGPAAEIGMVSTIFPFVPLFFTPSPSSSWSNHGLNQS